MTASPDSFHLQELQPSFASGMLPTYFPNTFPPQPGGSPRELAAAPRDSALLGLNCWEEKLFPPGSIHPAWHLPSPAGGNVLQDAPPTPPSTSTESWTQFHHCLIGNEKWDQVPCGSVSQEMGSEMHHPPPLLPQQGLTPSASSWSHLMAEAGS